MTVSELNIKAKALLETHFENIILNGELSKITIHSSGHWYFELKDENSSISCVIFKWENLKLNFIPKVGDFLELIGSLSLYSQSGRYQFIANTIKKMGFGDLEGQFLALKDRLDKEGLFDIKYKKQLPKFPLKIGIISSFTSAALEDMLKIIEQKSYFLAKIYVFNALTQGNLAPSSLINALKKADVKGLDVLIITRGGGSREDLFCFNDENLAREIFKAKTPIISAIGHEIDYVISDFVADLRAPTPSAAIDLLIPSRMDLEQDLDFKTQQLKIILQTKFKNLELELLNLEKILKANSLNVLISQKIDQSNHLKQQLFFSIKNKLNIAYLNLEKAENAYKQHESFFQKSKNLVNIEKDGKIVNLKDLKQNDKIILNSQDDRKQAQVL